jgi:hypothetical protein
MQGAPKPEPVPSLGRRLLWFVVLWVAGVAVLGAIAFAIRKTLM